MIIQIPEKADSLFPKMGYIARNALGLADVLWARQWGGRPRTLPTLLLFVTYRCNLRCAMCGVRHQSAGEELTLRDYEAILDRAQGLRTTLMLISGGEALSRGETVFEVIRMGAQRGIAAHLCTNGLLIDAETVRTLAACGLRSVSVSLESAVPEVHEQIRGVGSFAPAVRAVELLRAQAPGIRVGVNCTICALNYRDLATMIPFAESLKAHQLKFAPMHTNLLHGNKPGCELDALTLSEAQLPELEAEMKHVITALRASSLLTNHPHYLKHLPSAFSASRRFRCHAGYAACTIDPYGNVSPCPDISGGLTVRERPLDEIWRSDAFHQLRLQVCHCGDRCWDPLYTELSLRLTPGFSTLWQGFAQLWRDSGFYFGE